MSAEPNPAAAVKPRWQRFLESTGGAALVTTLVGGLVGAYITGLVQRGTKERELRLTAFREYADGELRVVQRVWEQIGVMVSASENLLVLTEPAFDRDRFAGEQRDAVMEQRKVLRDAFNEADRDWRRNRETLGFLLGYYHHGHSSLEPTWRKTQAAVDGFVACARDRYLADDQAASDDPSCEASRRKLDDELTSLNRALRESRRYAWDTTEPGTSAPADRPATAE
jgi:hypothetical protein